MTILDLLEEDHIRGEWTNSTYGKKYASPCPGCGGSDRFHVWFDQADSGRFWCRQCRKHGDVIGYLTQFRGVDYENACRILEIDPLERSAKHRSIPSIKTLQPQRCNEYPSKQWQTKAQKLIAGAIEYLWREEYTSILRWLNLEKGLEDKTIRLGRLGWLPQGYYLERSSWGLPEKLNENGVPKKLWVPSGLIIPCVHGGEIQRLRIRKQNPQDGSRYHIISGSSSSPMIWGGGDVLIVVESELDAMLLHQEVGNHIGVIALGSVMIKPDGPMLDLLIKAKRILVSLDSDDAGANISWKWWLVNFSNAVRWPCIRGKDPAEAYLNGLDLGAWVQAGIEYTDKKTTLPSPSVYFPQGDVTSIEVSATRQQVKNIQKLQGAPVISVFTKKFDPDLVNNNVLVVLRTHNIPSVMVNMVSDQTGELRMAIKELLEGSSEKVLYDAKDTIKILHTLGITITGPISDIRVADLVLRAGLENKYRTLEDVTMEYLGTSIISDACTYPLAIYDNISILLLRLRDVLALELKNNDLTNTADLEFNCIPATASMEINGVRVDRERLENIRDTISPLKEKLESRLHAELGAINLNSTFLIKKSLTSKNIYLPGTKSEILLDYVEEYPFLQDLIDYRRLVYILNQIINIFRHIDPITGRIYPHYDQLSATTGRYSTSEPNIQGISKANDLRSCIIADQGFKLVVADYSQIELRISAEISGDQRMIAAYKHEEDLHTLTASLITGKPLDAVTKKDRQAAKAVNFGLIYAMGTKGLKESAAKQYNVQLTEQEAIAFRDRFFTAYRGIADWHRKTELIMAKDARTLGGRRRIWPHGSKITELLNAPVQGTSADITKKALCLLHARLMNTGIKIVACIHDEIILEAPIEEADKAKQLLEGAMNEAGQVYLKKVPVKVEVSVVDTWADKG